MESGVFIFTNPANIVLTPTEYGSAIVQWSDKFAHKTLDNIQNSPIDGCSTYMQSFAAYLQLVALNTASYWAYALYVLQIPYEYLVGIQKGIKDGINEFHDPYGRPLTDDLNEYFTLSLHNYLDAILRDFSSAKNTNPNVFNPDISNVSSSFINTIESYLSKNGLSMQEITKTFVGNLVADIPSNICSALKEQEVVFKSK